MDCGSTIEATIKNPELLTNIRVSKEPIAMTTNAGTTTLTLEGDFPGFGSAYYDPKQAANIFGFATTVDKFD